jgi:hypothetical protein
LVFCTGKAFFDRNSKHYITYGEEEDGMKKRGLGLLVVVCLFGLMLGACAETKQEVRAAKPSPTPTVIVANPSVELSKTAKVAIYGTGFAPKQEVLFVFKDTGGVLTVISNDALAPAPVPNEVGAWVTTWDAGQYISLLKGDAMIVVDVTDSNYKTLTQVPVYFAAPPKKVEKK